MTRDDSIRALQRIPIDTPEGLDSLEASAVSWLARMEQSKWPRSLQHFENFSFLLGNHTTRYFYSPDYGLGYFQPDVSVPGDQTIAKSADNRLIRPVETVEGMLVQNSPQPRVTPNSDSVEDEEAADLAQLVTSLTWERPLNMPRRIGEATMVAMICGTAIGEIEYGPTDIPIEVPQMGMRPRANPLHDPAIPADDPNYEPPEVDTPEVIGTTTEPRHDLQARIWTPFHITVDPAATSEDDLTWVARTTFEDRDWIIDNFLRGDDDDDSFLYDDAHELEAAVPEESGTQYVLYWYQRFQDVLESPQYAHHGVGGLAPNSGTAGSAPNQCRFTVIDVKPCDTCPRGRTLILAGNTLVYVGQARAWSPKYPWRWHPYAFSHWFKVPGRFWGVALLSELVPLQKKINAIDAVVQANRYYISVGQWLIPKHSKMAEGRFSGLPGEQYTYTAAPGMPNPEKIRNVPLPAELLRERDDLITAIDAIAASGVVSKDQVSASAARAGSIFQFLRQERLRSKAPMIQSFERFLETMGQNVLIELQLNMTGEDNDLTNRIRVAAREHSDFAVESFTGASLRDHHAVKIDISSELLRSPEADESNAMSFFQAAQGQVSPQERIGLMRAMNLEKFMDSKESNSLRRARKMVARIIQGQFDAAVPLRGIESASSMAPVFDGEILSDRFGGYEPEVQKKLLELRDYYAKLAAEEQQQQIEQQIAIAQAMGNASKGDQSSGPQK